jgi:dienelactone hydrolase
LTALTLQSYFETCLQPSIPAGRPVTRDEVAKVVGGQDEPAPDLAAKLIDAFDNEHYRRETWTFQSRPGLSVYAYYLIPRNLTEPKPGILCLPGHGRGVDSIVGINEGGALRPWRSWGEYQADFALQCVSRGYPVLAIEQLSFGRRRSEPCLQEFSCVQDSMRLLSFGQTMIGFRAWDARRALNLLQTRGEVNPGKLAVMGISGGGAIAFFTAVLDERVGLACVSGYFNTFSSSILGVPHCPDNFAPGLANLGEMSDLAGLIAPRRLAVESGTLDDIFPIAAFEQAVEDAKCHWSDAADFTSDTFEGEHAFNGRVFWPALSRWADAK